MRGAKSKRTRPVREAARSVEVCCAGFKNARVGAVRLMRSAGAHWGAGGLPEDRSERTTHHVRGLSHRKINGFGGLEVKAEPEKLELQRTSSITAAPLYGLESGVCHRTVQPGLIEAVCPALCSIVGNFV